MITIDGTTYSVGVKSLKRNAEFLDKYAERTEGGALKRELIGVYFNYEIAFVPSVNSADYSALWDKLTEPEEFHTVVVPTDSGTQTFTAYFSNVSDELIRQDSTHKWFQSLTANFIAQVPARTP